MTTTPAPTYLDTLIAAASTALTAQAERTEGATDDDSACLKDEAECFRINPVHFAWYQLGETGVVGETKAIARVVIEATHKPLLDELAKTTRERDSLARRCAVRFEEAQQAERERDAAREELDKIRAELEIARLELATVTESADEATRQADGRRDEIDRLRTEQGTATTPRPYRDMPVYPCGKVGRGIAHMAHVYGVGEAEVACNGLLSHPVPLASFATMAEPADEPLITVRWPRIPGNDIHDLTQAESVDEPKAT